MPVWQPRSVFKRFAVSHLRSCQHYPIPTADPVSVVRFLIEQQDLTQRDLIPQFGSESAVSMFLAGQRRLTLKHLRKLSARFHLPGMLFFVRHSRNSGAVNQESRAYAVPHSPTEAVRTILLEQFAYDDPLTAAKRLRRYEKKRPPHWKASSLTATRIDGHFSDPRTPRKGPY